MNPQEILNQNIRMLIGDLQVQVMIANTRIQELETQLAAVQGSPEPSIPEVSRPNGRDRQGSSPPPTA